MVGHVVGCSGLGDGSRSLKWMEVLHGHLDVLVDRCLRDPLAGRWRRSLVPRNGPDVVQRRLHAVGLVLLGQVRSGSSTHGPYVSFPAGLAEPVKEGRHFLVVFAAPGRNRGWSRG